MKRILTATLVCSLFLLPVSAAGMTKEDFVKKAQEHYAGKLSFEDFSALCSNELQGDAKESTAYQAEIHANMAYAQIKRNNLPEAKADNEKALALNSKAARAVFNQGIILHMEGRHLEAYEHMMQSAAKAEKNQNLHAAFVKAARSYANSAAISAVSLWKAFDDNEVAAEDTYKGKLVIVRGKISSITTDSTGNPMVSFDVDRTGLVKVNCLFSKEDRSVLAQLKKGSEVIIPGICDGMLLKQVFISKCRID